MSNQPTTSGSVGAIVQLAMCTGELRAKLENLLRAVADASAPTGTPLQRLRGVAAYDSSKDQFITSLAQFDAVEQEIRGLKLVRERFGVNEARRIALQLVYGYFARANQIDLDVELLAALWVDVIAELESPVWLTRAVTNLRHFQCDEFPVELGDGLSIQGRNPEVLARLGFHPAISDQLDADWSGWGASSFVLVAETITEKSPDNAIMPDSSGTWLRCARAMGAMRLIAPGDVGVSVTFVQRVARFNFGIGGTLSVGATMRSIGKSYIWAPERHSLYDSTYAALAKLESIGYGRGPGNLDLALRAFMSSYDRIPSAPDERLVDAITALEAVLGGDAEIVFKLSFRVASLLAATDEQRSAMLKTVKGFYDARSRIVHGERLKGKHSAALAAVDELRDLVRKLLRAFVSFAADDTQAMTKKVFTEDLDAMLVNARQRDALRQSLGLVDPVPLVADSA